MTVPMAARLVSGAAWRIALGLARVPTGRFAGLSATAAVPTTAHRYPPGSPRAAFAYRNFRWFWIGLFLSSIGTWMQNLALPAYIEERTHSATWVSILVFAQLGPLLLLAIPGGMIADRVRPKSWLILCQSEQAVMCLVLAWFVARDASLWAIFGAQLAVGIGNALNAPASQASVPMMVDRRDLDGAVSLNSVMMNGSRVIGPALAAVLGVWGVTTAHIFVINAVSFLFLIGVLVMIQVPRAKSHHSAQGWRRALIGLQIARSRRVLSRILTSLCLFSFISLVFVALYPSVIRRNLDLDPEGSTYKWLYAVWGFGALLGALAVSTVLRRADKRRLIVAGFGGFALWLTVFAVLRSPVPAFPVAFLLGVFYFVAITAMATTFQQNMLDGERASVMPLWIMAFGGTVTIGGLVFGPIIDAIGARWVLVAGAVTALGLARWCDLRRLRPDDFL
jgi:MFS family permease